MKASGLLCLTALFKSIMLAKSQQSSNHLRWRVLVAWALLGMGAAAY
ncbi:MAG: hypothetical protein ACH34Y_09925 [Brachymonas sp.]|jgi:hypothetical protein